jgi:hypothetical protein
MATERKKRRRRRNYWTTRERDPTYAHVFHLEKISVRKSSSPRDCRNSTSQTMATNDKGRFFLLGFQMRDQLKTERCQVFRCFFFPSNLNLNFFIRAIISFLSRISFAYYSFRYLFLILLIFLIYYLSKSSFDLVGSSRAKHIGRADDQCRRSWVDESLFFFLLLRLYRSRRRSSYC